MSHPITLFKEALEKAQAYCALQDRCIFDLRKKMNDWLVDKKLHDDIIQSLIRDNFLDQQRYCEAFVSGKFKNNKWGKIKIQYNLRAKEIPTQIIEKALDSLDSEEYLNTLMSILIKKRKQIKDKDQYKIKAKLFQHAYSKGYESEMINLALQKTQQTDENI